MVIKGKISVMLLFAIILIAALLYLFFKKDPTTIIRKRAAELIKLVEVTDQESTLSAATKSQAMKDFFTSDVTIRSAYAPYTNNRGELISYIFSIRRHIQELRIRLSNQKITLNDRKTQAEMLVTVHAHAVSAHGKESIWEELAIDWVLTNKSWRITGATPADTIQAVP